MNDAAVEPAPIVASSLLLGHSVQQMFDLTAEGGIRGSFDRFARPIVHWMHGRASDRVPVVAHSVAGLEDDEVEPER
jgi:hypothetical protein